MTLDELIILILNYMSEHGILDDLKRKYDNREENNNG